MIEQALAVSASAIFCDDIRFEIGNKQSLIGTYSGNLGYSENLPPVDRIAVLVRVQWSGNKISRDCKIRIEVPGQIPMVQALDMPNEEFIDGDGSPFAGLVVQAAVQLRFAPLRVDDAINVWVQIGAKELPAGRLKVVRLENIAAVDAQAEKNIFP